ncbi:hypothetical protein EHQ46_05785 [Leptospira yanagawae]|uniref:Uncharacterized protein n=1 Tax=Leptospira yanagawae TaxID=293069 RepID=A0ABY2M7L4_9LEPT|nr:hypothetical protein [Leptospira yanagawae]TGL23147.1 hypothetical protein EHQ46_05785 [Leptospira yanagawae]
MTFFGIHGTCQSIAHRIQSSNFNISTGRGGSGVYFWRKGNFSSLLSFGWYQQSKYNGKFSGESDDSYAGIEVELTINKGEYLDLEDPDIKEELASLVVTKGIDSKADKRKIANLYDAFVKMVEKNAGVSMKLLILRVAPPQNCPEYPIAALGAPISYIARDSSIIKIINVESK